MARQALIVLLAFTVFGIGVPWLKGFAFLDPVLILAYSCIGILFVAPAATESLSSPLDPRRVLIRMAGLIGYGWGLSMLLLFSGLAVVNLQGGHEGLLFPRATLIVSAVLLGAAACLAIIALGGLLTRAYGSKSARSLLRLLFLVVLLVLAFGARYLPEDWQFMINSRLTTSGITSFAYRAAAVLGVAGALGTAWLCRLAKRV